MVFSAPPDGEGEIVSKATAKATVSSQVKGHRSKVTTNTIHQRMKQTLFPCTTPQVIVHSGQPPPSAIRDFTLHVHACAYSIAQPCDNMIKWHIRHKQPVVIDLQFPAPRPHQTRSASVIRSSIFLIMQLTTPCKSSEKSYKACVT